MTAPRLLLVGAGTMGSLHARVIAQSPLAELAVVVDGREEAARELAERHGASYRTEIGDLEGIDGVVIAASTEAHYGLCLEVLNADTPLLVEKPVADGLDKTMEILDTAERRGVPISCGLLERFNPAVITAKTLVDQPMYVSAVRHSPYAARIKTGVAWDLLVHDVDLAIGFIDAEPRAVSGLLGQFHPLSVPGAEDIAEATIGFDNGAVAHISASRTSQRKIRTLTIQELDRLIEVDLLRKDVTVYRHVSDQPADAEGRGYRQQTVIEIPELATSLEPLAAQLSNFVGLIDGTVDVDRERRSIIPAHRIVEQLRASHRAG